MRHDGRVIDTRPQRTPWPPLVKDGILAVAVTSFVVWSAFGERTKGEHITTTSLVIIAGLLPSIWVRRRWPGLSLLLTAAVQAGLAITHTAPGAWQLAEVIAPYSIAVYGSFRTRLVAQALGGAVLVAAALPSASGLRTGVLFPLLAAAGAWVVGAVNRTRRAWAARLAEQAANRVQEREEQARRAVEVERLRIARELHDVVAHNVIIVVVQAQALQRLIDTDPLRARQASVAIEETAREALLEMRQMLGLLRQGDSDGEAEPAGEYGAPAGLAMLDELVGNVRAAGLPVTVTVDGTPRRIAGGADLAAYRIVQEALTNTLKHGGNYVHADVAVRYLNDDVELTIRDDGRGAAAHVPAANGTGPELTGHGLTGMRERVAALGGELRTGPRPGGGYEVWARLPLPDSMGG
jgi:signal transduction histidine kinase